VVAAASAVSASYIPRGSSNTLCCAAAAAAAAAAARGRVGGLLRLSCAQRLQQRLQQRPIQALPAGIGERFAVNVYILRSHSQSARKMYSDLCAQANPVPHSNVARRAQAPTVSSVCTYQ
jgi:hypothetical protein